MKGELPTLKLGPLERDEEERWGGDQSPSLGALEGPAKWADGVRKTHRRGPRRVPVVCFPVTWFETPPEPGALKQVLFGWAARVFLFSGVLKRKWWPVTGNRLLLSRSGGPRGGLSQRLSSCAILGWNLLPQSCFPRGIWFPQRAERVCPLFV